MTFLSSLAVRQTMLDAMETLIGTGATLEIRSGAQPDDITAADTGTLLATVALPDDWLNDAAASGQDAVKTLLGTWADANGVDADGTAGHYRLKDSLAAVHFEGSITATGGGGDMTLDNTVLATGQEFSITNWSVRLNARA